MEPVLFSSTKVVASPKDHLGSIKVIVNTSGNRVAHTDLYPLGFEMPGRVSCQSGPDCRYKFTGKERDTETNYDYFGARYYDARIGRWLQVDPLQGLTPAMNSYHYCRNNPTSFIDIMGLNHKHPDWHMEPIVVEAERWVEPGYRNYGQGIYFLEEGDEHNFYEEIYKLRRNILVKSKQGLVNFLKGFSPAHIMIDEEKTGLQQLLDKSKSAQEIKQILEQYFSSKGIAVKDSAIQKYLTGLAQSILEEFVSDPATNSFLPNFSIRFGKGLEADTTYYDPSIEGLIKTIKYHSSDVILEFRFR